MQENRKDTLGQEAQHNHEPVQTFREGTHAQPGRQKYFPQNLSGRDISEMDQQEGSMNNGRLGGNFDASPEVDMNYMQDSPPY